MKFMLTHCYTDSNKGDAGIIIATTQLIKDAFENAEVNFMSTYSEHDEQYKTEHTIINNYSQNTYPNVFGEPVKAQSLGEFSRLLSFMSGLFKALLVLISSNSHFLRIFLSKNEIEGIKEFLNSDVVISKGGSFLYSEDHSIRQSLSLIRMLYPFWLAKRYNKKIVIFSQSLGPVNGSFNKLIFRLSLKDIQHIYLRESLCLDKYNEVKNLAESVGFSIIPDSAFYMKDNNEAASFVNFSNIDNCKMNIGLTIVDHDFKYIKCAKERDEKRESYKDSIIKFIEYAYNNYNANINIFSQVRALNSHLGHSDVLISREIEKHFFQTPISVVYHDDNWTPLELREFYKRMDVFVGTRLHSVIFSLSVSTPVINIAYHGTKSQGIFANIPGIESYVVDINNINSEKIISLFEKILNDKVNIKSDISHNIEVIREKLLLAMKTVIR